MVAVLVGGPFDGASAELLYAPGAVGVYVDPDMAWAWKDALVWTDWGGGRNPAAVKYVLEDGAPLRYLYAAPSDPSYGEPDWIAEQLGERVRS